MKRDTGRLARAAQRMAPLSLIGFVLAAVVVTSLFSSVAAAADFAGYVKSTALNVRDSAGSKSAIAGILLKYDPVTVTGESNVGGTRWYSIEASGGYVKGWVAARFITRGEAPASISEGPIDYGAQETPTLMKGAFKYVGVKVCANCHTESTGKFDKGAFQVWESHFHSQAHKTLQRDYTKEIAKRTRGVENPATDWRCVKCHQAAFGAAPEQTASSYRAEEGVGCEVCHGPGSAYAEEDHGPNIENREAMGFRVLRDLTDRREVCTSCHNRASPTFIGFDLREFSRKIAHWVDKDDADYYAESKIETARRAKRIKESSKTGAADGAMSSGAKAAAGAAGAASTASAAAARKAKQATADAAKAASDAKSASSALAAEAANAAEAAKSKAAAKAANASKAAKAKADAAARKLADADAARQAEQENAKAAQAAATQRTEQARAEAKASAQAEADKKAGELREAKAKAEKKAALKAKKAEAKAKKPIVAATSAASDPLRKYLEDVDKVIVMNRDGKKYKKVKFSHLKHSTGEYLDSMTCQTCHHTQEDDDTPQSCNECHDIDGDADESKTKKRYVHAKGLSYPKEPDQEQVSCVSCHKASNAMLDAGERQGEAAPTKCTTCHARNK